MERAPSVTERRPEFNYDPTTFETIQRARRDAGEDFDVFYEMIKKTASVALTVLTCLIVSPIVLGLAGAASTLLGLVAYLSLPLFAFGVWATANSIVDYMEKQHHIFEKVCANFFLEHRRVSEVSY